ncbi:hypothetical protein CBL_12313 [Carabus blaptoides fortunei]
MVCSLDLSSPGPSHSTAAPRSSSVDAVKRKCTLDDDGQDNERLVEMRKEILRQEILSTDDRVTTTWRESAELLMNEFFPRRDENDIEDVRVNEQVTAAERRMFSDEEVASAVGPGQHEAQAIASLLSSGVREPKGDPIIPASLPCPKTDSTRLRRCALGHSSRNKKDSRRPVRPPAPAPADTTGRSTRLTHSAALRAAANDGQEPETPVEPRAAQPTMPHECRLCPRSFSTASGLGVHMRRAHTVEANEAVQPATKKARWSDEELTMLAQEEARATMAGVVHMNKHLLDRLKGRTLEAIKGARRKAEYRDLVRAAVIDARTSPPPVRVESPIIEDQHDNSEDRQDPQPSTSRGKPDKPQHPHARAIMDLLVLIYEAEGSDPHAAELVDLAHEALSGQDVGPGIIAWLRALPGGNARTTHPTSRAAHTTKAGAKHRPETSRAKRRTEYARVQNLWTRNQKAAAQEVMQGAKSTSIYTLETLAPYWENLLTQPSLPMEGPTGVTPRHNLRGLWDPITCQETELAQVSTTSAPGLDKITPRTWRKVPSYQKALLFNIMMFTGQLPRKLLMTRTIFISKQDSPTCPSQFRPISIGSVTRAFIEADGACENLAVLDAILSSSKQHLRELHIATLDMAKAFDTVGHHALQAILPERRMPPDLTEYVRLLYSEACTRLEVRGQLSEPIPVTRGVRQGDPLSPALFNLAIDCILKAVPRGVGFELGDTTVSALAFADDLVLVASSRWGLQQSINQVEEAARNIGLSFNTQKSSTLSIVPAGKVKKVKIDTEHRFSTTLGPLPPTGVVGKWTYLVVEFGVAGSLSVAHNLATILANITRVPLKPQQRLEILDREVRASTRRWLRLPADTPMAFFHAAIRDGGLGLPALTTLIPSLVSSRYHQLEQSSYMAAQQAFKEPTIQRKLRWARKALIAKGLPVTRSTAAQRQRWWAQQLHESVDGRELREAARCPVTTSWVQRPAHVIPGRDFVQHVHTRINTLPSRIRVSRGARRNQREVQCRGSCQATETAAHVIQCCWRTHGGRVLRHNAVADRLTSELQAKGWTVVSEPHIQTTNGLRKPDNVASREQKGLVLDVQIVSGAQPLSQQHPVKAAKYDDPDILRYVSTTMDIPPEATSFSSRTISWRGIWAA